MGRTITVMARSDLIVSKNKKTYFTITDETGQKYISFKPSLHPEVPVGTQKEIEWEPGKMADDTPRLLGIVGQKTEEPGRSLIKEAIREGAVVIEPTDDTRLRSMAVSYSKDLAVAGKIELKEIAKYADKFLNYILHIKGKEE